MQSNFEKIMVLEFDLEGGFTDNPHDPGGATNYGITQNVYNAWMKSQGKTPSSVKFMSKLDALQIYKVQYWDHIRGNDLPSGVDQVVMDEAINSGEHRAIVDLQSLLGVKADGTIGLLTMQALQRRRPLDLVNAYESHRLSWLYKLKNWKFFKNGWTKRVNRVRSAGITLAGG